MSVFTPVSRDELNRFLEIYQLGGLVSQRGIEAGVENTNYFVSTSTGRYVLTLFEKYPAEQLPYYLELMQHLALAGIPVPRPLAANDGSLLQRLNQRPAVLVECLSGATPIMADSTACGAIGQMLAQIHLAAADFPQQRIPEHDHHWRMRTAQRVLSDVTPAEAGLLEQEITYQQALDTRALPMGTIHADLFLDNTLFEHDRLSGVIDWYYACYDHWLYDLAVVVNDWCSLPDGRLDEQRLRVCLQHYHRQRPLTEAEFACWPGILRAAALRFWLSRLLDKLYPRAGEMVLQKDPAECRDKLQQRIAQYDLIRSCWPVRL